MKKQIFIVNVIITSLLVFFSTQCKKDNNSVGQNTATKWDTVFADNFQRDDGPIGNKYIVQVENGNGAASISSDQLMFEGSGYWAIYDTTTSVTGNIIRVSINCNVMIGSPSFGVSIKNQKPSSSLPIEFYGAFLNSRGIAICKYIQPSNAQSGPIDTLIKKSITFQNTHTYKLQLVDNNKNLTAYIEDISAMGGTKDSIQVTDTSSLTGTYVGINGKNTGITDEILFDNFVIEKGN